MSPRHLRRRLWKLYARDPRCWFCGMGFPPFPVTTKLERKHAEPTVEHLLPRSKGGTNRRENTVLAHQFRNVLAADRSPEEKMAIRERMRAAIAELAGRRDESGGRGVSQSLELPPSTTAPSQPRSSLVRRAGYTAPSGEAVGLRNEEGAFPEEQPPP